MMIKSLFHSREREVLPKNLSLSDFLRVLFLYKRFFSTRPGSVRAEFSMFFLMLNSFQIIYIQDSIEVENVIDKMSVSSLYELSNENSKNLVISFITSY